MCLSHWGSQFLHGAQLRAQGIRVVNLPLCSGLHLCKRSPEGSFKEGLDGGNLPNVMQCFSKKLNKAEGNCMKFM